MYHLLESRYYDSKSDKLTTLENEYNTTLELIKKGDWKYFVNSNLTKYQKELSQTKDSNEKKRFEALIDLEEYRLANNVIYDESNYLHNALEDIKINLTEYLNLKNKSSLTSEEEKRYAYLQEQIAQDKYILDNKVDILNNTNLKSVFANFASEFGLFILIYIILIFGPIVSEEYNKGTIKYLLIKPYRRSTILLSKLLTGLLFIPFIILLMLALEFLIGGLILGFSSINIPVLIYDSAKNILVVYPILKYTILSLLSILPMYLILGILAFTLSTITASTSAAITITFLFYLLGNVISNLALVYKFKIFKFFVSLHWDFSYLIAHTSNPYHFSINFSLVILGLYIIVMLCLAFLYFRKKDVKNI